MWAGVAQQVRYPASTCCTGFCFEASWLLGARLTTCTREELAASQCLDATGADCYPATEHPRDTSVRAVGGRPTCPECKAPGSTSQGEALCNAGGGALSP